MFSGIPDFYPLEVSSTSAVVTSKNVSRPCLLAPGKQNQLPRERTFALELAFFLTVHSVGSEKMAFMIGTDTVSHRF